MKTSLKGLTIASIAVALNSCYVDDSDPGPIPDNGDASISGQVKHHNDPIPNAKVYLKIHANEFPGSDTRIYNDSTVANPLGFYEFKNLHQASYYLYSVGYDSSYSEMVKGGIPVVIDAPGKPLSINIPVAE